MHNLVNTLHLLDSPLPGIRIKSNTSETRVFRKLRISITESCNLACIYCDAQKENPIGSPKTDFSMLLDIVGKLHAQLNLESVRITGGEPTLSRNLPKFVSNLKRLGIGEINLTSNGMFLENMLPDLYEAGLDRINISLDAMDENIFSKITGTDGVGRVRNSILKARDMGYSVKINSIIMRGFNESQILPLLAFALESKILIRFLELMKMGWAANSHRDNYYSQNEILSQINTKYNVTDLPRKSSSTARYYKIDGTVAFGLISNHSEPFCADCDRLRLDHKGNLYGCLSNPVFFPMANRKEKDYPLILGKAMSLKQKKEFTGSNLNMRHIGG